LGQAEQPFLLPLPGTVTVDQEKDERRPRRVVDEAHQGYRILDLRQPIERRR
jgi:hypothetical protein